MSKGQISWSWTKESSREAWDWTKQHTVLVYDWTKGKIVSILAWSKARAIAMWTWSMARIVGLLGWMKRQLSKLDRGIGRMMGHAYPLMQVVTLHGDSQALASQIPGKLVCSLPAETTIGVTCHTPAERVALIQSPQCCQQQPGRLHFLVEVNLARYRLHAGAWPQLR